MNIIDNYTNDVLKKTINEIKDVIRFNIEKLTEECNRYIKSENGFKKDLELLRKKRLKELQKNKRIENLPFLA